MSFINIPEKNIGDPFTAVECNDIVNAILKMQTSTGWGIYKDTIFTDLVPQEIPPSVWTPLGNNAGVKDESFLPSQPDGVTPFPLYDGVKIVMPVVGATMSGDIHFTAKVASNNGIFDIGLDVGGATGIVFINTLLFPQGQNVYHDFTIPINLPVTQDFFDNGAQIVARSKTGGTSVFLYDSSVYVNINSQPA